jgi:hypothetical protein
LRKKESDKLKFSSFWKIILCKSQRKNSWTVVFLKECSLKDKKYFKIKLGFEKWQQNFLVYIWFQHWLRSGNIFKTHKNIWLWLIY